MKQSKILHKHFRIELIIHEHIQETISFHHYKNSPVFHIFVSKKLKLIEQNEKTILPLHISLNQYLSIIVFFVSSFNEIDIRIIIVILDRFI